jgi:peptidoglycan/xylan/chitin deacetylase (PgdA/CDA1 family)
LNRALWFVPAPAPVFPALADALRIERRLAGARAAVALTFDDGPHARGTPAVLDALAAGGARATFFLVGEQVEREPALAAEIAAAGHEIALHGHRHRLLLRRRVDSLGADLDRAMDAIGEATGATPACYRPPYGVFSSGGLELVRRRGWRPVLWSKWGRDWTRRATPATIASLATGGLGAGDIVLLHDADHYSVTGSWEKTAAALPRILDTIAGLGLACAVLSRPS